MSYLSELAHNPSAIVEALYELMASLDPVVGDDTGKVPTVKALPLSSKTDIDDEAVVLWSLLLEFDEDTAPVDPKDIEWMTRVIEADVPEICESGRFSDSDPDSDSDSSSGPPTPALGPAKLWIDFGISSADAIHDVLDAGEFCLPTVEFTSNAALFSLLDDFDLGAFKPAAPEAPAAPAIEAQVEAVARDICELEISDCPVEVCGKMLQRMALSGRKIESGRHTRAAKTPYHVPLLGWGAKRLFSLENTYGAITGVPAKAVRSERRALRASVSMA